MRNAFTLGTSLTALFLLVRCSVPGRDYSQLGIGQSAGSGGEGGTGDDIVFTSGGRGGQGGQGGLTDPDAGLGGQGGAPPVPIPCVEVVSKDAGVSDAGTDGGLSDAGDAGGTRDAGGLDPSCACVDGFVQAIDADGDGDGTRACSLAPGLDCDDANSAVTHNSCGGCSELSNTIGTDCSECGTYVCDGPEAVACASKPGPVEDPDCRCLNALIVARDTDNDGQGTRLCEANPGTDCNDGDSSFVSNACGGCDPAPGALGALCNECGVWSCNGAAIVCQPPPGNAAQECVNTKTRRECVGSGFWDDNQTCPNVCYQGSCQTCIPGTFRCVDIGGGSYQLEQCASTSSYGIHWASDDSCSTNQTCDAVNGQCITGQLFLPRDLDFDVVPALPRGTLPWHDILNTASNSDYG